MVEVTVSRVEIVFSNALKIMEVPAPEPIHALLTIRFDQFILTMKGDHVMYNLPADHTVQMQVAYVDSGGNPATIDNDVIWSSSDTNIVTVAADAADSTICRVTPVGVGQAQVTATVDADIGEGERELVTLADITVVGGEAVAGTIAPVGAPEPINPA
jgi:hypothetical protein